MSDKSCLVVKFNFKCRCEIPSMYGKCTNEEGQFKTKTGNIIPVV